MCFCRMGLLDKSLDLIGDKLNARFAFHDHDDLCIEQLVLAGKINCCLQAAKILSFFETRCPGPPPLPQIHRTRNILKNNSHKNRTTTLIWRRPARMTRI